MHYIRGSDLSISQANTLMRLYHHGPGSVNDLADHLGITVAAVSQLLNPLIDQGYIVRSTSASDRRIKLIALTEYGKKTVENGIQQRHAWVNDLAKEFSPNEQVKLLPTLELLNDRILTLMEKTDPRCYEKRDSKT
jgi:DNA-binding MarR family transcriptional regulator